ncbi:hypothetical protein KSP39_PZI007219 [Platanthera zijinensis]|uniref:RNA-polymerase II-associated protein 3-like C-terminal domain-containing protein n=1 Tax=Platanthera zijinensis TaxID=2320716 RepID=A0AAP0G9G2_9ASPA
MEFRGFLKDQHDHDSLNKDGSAKLKGRAKKTAESAKGKISEDREPSSKFTTDNIRKNNANVFSSIENSELSGGYLRNLDTFDTISSSFLNEEKLPDANSEKELGNDYFKHKKYLEAIECYSRSIAFAPTSVAFANRAMAYLKLKKFEEAENDCTYALNLDDRYVKAYSRRATSRKELMKFEGAMEDADFALRLEPNSPEIRKQYSEIKEILERKGVKNVSEQKESNAASKESQAKGIYSVTITAKTAEASITQTMKHEPDGRDRNGKLKKSMQDLASRAASRVMETVSKNVTTPTSAYQFEVSWRSLSNDSEKQAQLLKIIPPADLPKIFKNALSAPVLIDIIRCIATFFADEPILAVSMIDYLTKVPRFDMIIMCLSTMDRAELHRLWEEVFSNDQVEVGLKQVLIRLRPKYYFGA